ncbi:MAG: TlyA family RNA methyltransferase [Lachnospiraceae bacterium]|nr:TlyA family RNA methyltransferase [Lachnospiraceae bacterium]
MSKERLDVILVQRGLAPSREKAKALIMAGAVYVDGQKEDKAGSMFDDQLPVEVRSNTQQFVSRGGHKLEKALQVFPIDLTGRICIDVGASTGGFTDCMLQKGAVQVCSVDVGRGQLCWQLRNDPRVICMEKTNMRYVQPEDLPVVPSFAASDVSFISLTLILEPIYRVLAEDGEVVVLIKPQFEAGRERVGKKGVVRDPQVHEDVIEKIVLFAQSVHFKTLGLDFSPIRGPEGNIEYLLWMKKLSGEEICSDTPFDIAAVVKQAHEELDR